MSKIMLSEMLAILKIHGIAQGSMVHHYAQMQSLVQDLGGLLHERPSMIGDHYQPFDQCLRDTLSTYQEAGIALAAYEGTVWRMAAEHALVPVLPLGDYQALVHAQSKAYDCLKYQHLCMKSFLSMMCMNYGFESDSTGAFCIEQLKAVFETAEAFTQKMVLLFHALKTVLDAMLKSKQDHSASGIELMALVFAECQRLSLETASCVPAPYGSSERRLERLKDAQMHRNKRVMAQERQVHDESPPF